MSVPNDSEDGSISPIDVDSDIDFPDGVPDYVKNDVENLDYTILGERVSVEDGPDDGWIIVLRTDDTKINRRQATDAMESACDLLENHDSHRLVRAGGDWVVRIEYYSDS